MCHIVCQLCIRHCEADRISARRGSQCRPLFNVVAIQKVLDCLPLGGFMMKWGAYTPEQSMGILRSTGCGQERSGREKGGDGKRSSSSHRLGISVLEVLSMVTQATKNDRVASGRPQCIADSSKWTGTRRAGCKGIVPRQRDPIKLDWQAVGGCGLCVFGRSCQVEAIKEALMTPPESTVLRLSGSLHMWCCDLWKLSGLGVPWSFPRQRMH